MMQSLLGIFLIIAVCYAFSADRSAITWRPVIAGISVQLVLVVLLLKVTFIAEALLSLNIIVETLEAATQQLSLIHI